MTDIYQVQKIHSMLQQKIKLLDNQLISQLSPTIERIQQVRYNKFTDCVHNSQTIPKCYEQSLQLQLRPDFQSHSNLLQKCLNSVQTKKDWEKSTNQCFDKYEKGLRKSINIEINRVLKHLNL